MEYYPEPKSANNQVNKRVTDLTKDEIAELFPVLLFPPNEEWKEIYARERDLILSQLGDKIIRIEHFGSTSIPNITAKDTIDILIEIDEQDNFSDEIINKLRAIEYDYIRQNEDGIEHMIFVKGYGPTGEKGQTFHIHMGPKNHRIWDRIFFRDYLTEKQDIADQYEALKIELSDKFKYDRVGYRIAKTEFVQRVTEQAKQHYQTST
ncbi:MAG: GrpB family protein [Cyclobacteriaceae bacterium]